MDGTGYPAAGDGKGDGVWTGIGIGGEYRPPQGPIPVVLVLVTVQVAPRAGGQKLEERELDKKQEKPEGRRSFCSGISEPKHTHLQQKMDVSPH